MLSCRLSLPPCVSLFSLLQCFYLNGHCRNCIICNRQGYAIRNAEALIKRQIKTLANVLQHFTIIIACTVVKVFVPFIIFMSLTTDDNLAADGCEQVR